MISCSERFRLLSKMKFRTETIEADQVMSTLYSFQSQLHGFSQRIGTLEQGLSSTQKESTNVSKVLRELQNGMSTQAGMITNLEKKFEDGRNLRNLKEQIESLADSLVQSENAENVIKRGQERPSFKRKKPRPISDSFEHLRRTNSMSSSASSGYKSGVGVPHQDSNDSQLNLSAIEEVESSSNRLSDTPSRPPPKTTSTPAMTQITDTEELSTIPPAENLEEMIYNTLTAMSDLLGVLSHIANPQIENTQPVFSS